MGWFAGRVVCGTEAGWRGEAGVGPLYRLKQHIYTLLRYPDQPGPLYPVPVPRLDRVPRPRNNAIVLLCCDPRAVSWDRSRVYIVGPNLAPRALRNAPRAHREVEGSASEAARAARSLKKGPFRGPVLGGQRFFGVASACP